MVDRITAIVLVYQEGSETLECLKSAGFSKIIYADRGGIGPIAKPFNDAFANLPDDAEYVWFLTNVGFDPEMPAALVADLDRSPRIAAIHPAFDSDHGHISSSSRTTRDIPFVEWTAPMVRASAFRKIGPLDEQMPYWGHDLDWSYRAKQMGYTLQVNGAYRLRHEYLRHVSQKKNMHSVTYARAQERAKYDASTMNRLSEKYGKKWRDVLWP